jgi:hypothetical protein
LVVVGLLLVVVVPKERVTKENYERISFGGTREQVEELLGPPHFEPGKSPLIMGGGGTFSSMLMEQEGHVWVAPSMRIYVRFNRDDRVAGVMRRGTGETRFAKLRRWLRF